MSAKKTIQVNKEFLSLNNRSVKKDKPAKKPRSSSKTLASPNKVKKEFLKKIKEFQNKRIESLKSGDVIEKTTEEKDFEQEFNKSLMFLQNVASEKEKKQQQPQNVKAIEISLVLPKSMEPDKPIPPSESRSTKADTVSIQLPNSKINLPQRPMYSSLKNSSKPTYREWIKTQRSTSSSKIPQVIIKDMPVPEETERSSKLAAYKKEKKIDKVKTKKMTTTIKRILGKTSNSVGVLIKSRQTRRKIQHEQAKLNQTSIHDIKKYLRERNLIKVGSTSPNDILRKLYEQCILAGDITNNSENIMLHNFINDKKPE